MKRTKYLARAAALVSAAGCAGLAHGQSSVTMYGVVDLPIGYANNLAASAPTINPVTGVETRQPGANRFGIQGAGGMSGSRWGIRGVEDLGGGLKALFVLESGFAADTGQVNRAGAMFSRRAFVGLQSSSLGQISLGRQNTSLYESLGDFMPAK